MKSDKALITEAIKAVQAGDVDRLNMCDRYNAEGKLDTNDCVDCPLWHGAFQGGCCKGLRRAAKYAVLRALGGGVPQTRMKKHRLDTLVDHLTAILEADVPKENV
jgi:hypothetical protein